MLNDTFRTKVEGKVWEVKECKTEEDRIEAIPQSFV
jgi:hypothetical protein